MIEWSIWADIATVLTSISLIGAIISLARETRTQNLQSFFYLHGYLSQDEFSKARKAIRTEQFCKLYSSWTEEDKMNANKVCASYDQTGIFLSMGILDKKTMQEFLSSSWGDSIIDQYESLAPFLDDNQTPTQTGREFFRHFAWLYNEAKKYH